MRGRKISRKSAEKYRQVSQTPKPQDYCEAMAFASDVSRANFEIMTNCNAAGNC
jgi:hypothetical protein